MQNNTITTFVILGLIIIGTVFAFLYFQKRKSTEPTQLYGFLGKKLTVATVLIFAILAIGSTAYFLQTNNVDDRSQASINDNVTIDFVKKDAVIELTGKFLNQTTNEYIFEWKIKASNTVETTKKETKLSVSKISIANANTPIQISLQIKDVITGQIVGTKTLEIK